MSKKDVLRHDTEGFLKRDTTRSGHQRMVSLGVGPYTYGTLVQARAKEKWYHRGLHGREGVGVRVTIHKAPRGRE